MRFRAIFAFGLVAVASASAHAQTAGMVSFQGLIRSTEPGNPPITTPVSLEFRIFNADTGGTQVDMDGDGTLEPTAAGPGAGTDAILVGPLSPNGGIVSTKFGPVSPKAFAGCTPGVVGCRWLEVTVVGSATPLSRIEMVTPPGAAEQVNRQTGAPLVSQDASGNVGIGTTTPLAKLHVAGGLTVDSAVTAGSAEIFGTCSIDFHSPDNPAVDYTARMIASTDNSLVLQTRATANLLALKHDRVGVGTNDPTAKLAVQQAVDTNAGGIAVTNTSVNRSLHAWVDSSSRGRIDVGVNADSPICLNAAGVGNVGIGTTDPSSKLSIRRDDDGRLLSFERTGMESWWVGPITTGSRGLAFANATDTDAVRLMLAEPGTVGIGTTSPVAKLDVFDPGSPGRHGLSVLANCDAGFATMRVHSDHNPDGSRILLSVTQQANPRLVVRMDGKVGIGTSSPSATLHVNGDIITTNGTCCGSDARFKKNISTVTTAMAKLLSLRGVWFQWKEPKEHGDEARRQMGMIAQEVEKVLPEWVIKDNEGYRYLNTTGFPALAVEAMREMKTENDALKSKVSALEDRLARLEKALDNKSRRSGNSERQE